METNEHKQAGNQIRIETLGNPYLKGSKKLLPAKGDELVVRVMQQIDGIPVPLTLELTAGDIVALAGDYYTKAGWGLKLDIPQRSSNPIADNVELFKKKVAPQETVAFLGAYSDLASTEVQNTDIDKIYKIENTTYIPFIKSLNSLFQQLVYSFTVKGYGEKLLQNEAHFSPWSSRAYIVGHHSALHNAELALACYALSANNEEPEGISQPIGDELQILLQKIKLTPEKYGFTVGTSQSDIYSELGHRFHALAVSQDLFAMHFYSDHYAGGHMSRIGVLRQTMPQRFGKWGSILINNMHNEDNTRSVEVINPHQPSSTGSNAFRMYSADDEAYGDGTYFDANNNENSNMLVNGMTNSLGDIARYMQTGIKPAASEYGGLCFLPEVDYQKPQTQPLLIDGGDGKVYFRSDVSRIQILSPAKYQATLQDPKNHGYEELTYWKAFALVFKLRVLGPLYSPKIDNSEVVDLRIENHSVSDTTQSFRGESAELIQSNTVEPVMGAWRGTPPTPDALRCKGFLSIPTRTASNSEVKLTTPVINL
ncbi:hypothetical protein [Legionella jamestowniensis]|uniref:Dot/Icm secretion system substrate n=1 Tax=Legionella jamestowniensis TaxID=455 RepID=A0A0W0UHB9_9GAMM|nr:hypothetical protein [Legionella jamestowniensis]KTD07030.1 Dot/Icm secretion system substrate [Legionella jamestowniensis]SFM03521.1 hypothetical protein SAMN02746073_0059 [Legionella jamestowniensis DSM 19215]